MTEQADPRERDLSPASHGIAGLVVTNSSLIAILVYMGWDYEFAYYSHFKLNPIDLGVGIPEYLLHCINLFDPLIVIAAVAVIAVLAFSDRIAELARTALPWPRPHGGRLWRSPRAAQTMVGGVLTLAALALAEAAGYVQVSTYLLLALLAMGPLLLTRQRRQDRSGRIPYILAIVVAVVAALWAGSLYARDRGNKDANNLASTLRSSTAVAVYSAQDLAITDTGVLVQKLPPGHLYHYRYIGLRLLTMRSGTYYLLPYDWTPPLGVTFILAASDQIRVELYRAG